jgi:hypothetical protein
LGSKKNRDEQQRQKQISNRYMNETTTSKSRERHSALRVAPARFYDRAVLALISRIYRFALHAVFLGFVNLQQMRKPWKWFPGAFRRFFGKSAFSN